MNELFSTCGICHGKIGLNPCNCVLSNVDAVNTSKQYVDKTQNNRHEPVAWMNEYEQICHATDKRLEEITNDIGSPRNYFKYNIPLYTHPVKELTDAETALRFLYEAIIRYENLSLFPDKYAVESCEFQLHDAKEKARAILRKAQEK